MHSRSRTISTLVRESVLRFIESEGHKTELDVMDDATGAATIRLRVRGQVVSVGISETDATYFSVGIAFALPDWARDEAQSAPILLDLQGTFKAVKFFYAQSGDALVAAVEQFSSTPQEFTQHFWRIVGIVRDAGNAALGRVLDRTESKAAAERFIKDFMRGQEP